MKLTTSKSKEEKKRRKKREKEVREEKEEDPKSDFKMKFDAIYKMISFFFSIMHSGFLFFISD